MQIVKRDESEQEYSLNKIFLAILAASTEVYPDDKNTAEEVAFKVSQAVDNHIQEKFKKPSVEDIQDTIEHFLMKKGHYTVARAFILYREAHRVNRESNWLDGELAETIWEKKYRYGEETQEEFLNRVTNSDKTMKALIREKTFCPAGRILANRSLQNDGKKITYSNCYVIPKPEDNLESIFDAAYNLARTFSYGGGCGLDITHLRPKGAKVNNAAITTTGATSFMHLYDATSDIIGQKGRRGALMISMNVEHPDIEQFIQIKQNLDSVTKANISLRMTDKFMSTKDLFDQLYTVRDTGEIIHKQVNVDQILNKIALANWKMAEPGMLFWDRIQNWCIPSNDPAFKFAGTNPCGELPLPEGGSCLLSSINLANFVINPYQDTAYFDYDSFDSVVRKGVIFLNECLDEGIRLHPLRVQRESVRLWRQIGLGIMGLADMFIKLQVTYGTKKSIKLIDKIGYTMINAALQQSALLAKKDGPYPTYHSKYILDSPFIKSNSSSETYKLILKHGLRNSQLLTIAPTGTISNLFGVSGGVEPIFALSYKRTTKSLHETDQTYDIFTPIVKEYMETFNIPSIKELPSFFVTSHDIDYKDRIIVQSTWQKYIDNSISSTVNLPHSISVKEIKELYYYAWKKKLKGITIYRDGCQREGILSTEQTINSSNISDEELIKQNICPVCKGELQHEGGCLNCHECGYSACSN